VARRRLRSQVERLEGLTGKAQEKDRGSDRGLAAGAALVADSSSRALRASAVGVAAREKRFAARLAVWEAAKAKHRAALRPQMGRPDSAAALEELCDREGARSNEVLAAIAEVQREVLQATAEQSVAFVEMLSEQAASALALLDTLVLTDDLGYLLGDELVEKKRRSLKRLKKLHRAQEAEAEGEEEERSAPIAYEKPSGRHCPSRVWPPLPVAQLRFVFEKHGVAIQGLKGTAWPADAAPVAPVDWIAELAQRFGGPSSLVTTAQRLVVRARDESWAALVAAVGRNLARCEAHFGQLQRAEQRWEGTWRGLVDALVQDNRDAER
jgi:hypothetical protein